MDDGGSAAWAAYAEPPQYVEKWQAMVVAPPASVDGSYPFDRGSAAAQLPLQQDLQQDLLACLTTEEAAFVTRKHSVVIVSSDGVPFKSIPLKTLEAMRPYLHAGLQTSGFQRSAATRTATDVQEFNTFWVDTLGLESGPMAPSGESILPPPPKHKYERKKPRAAKAQAQALGDAVPEAVPEAIGAVAAVAESAAEAGYAQEPLLASDARARALVVADAVGTTPMRPVAPRPAPLHRLPNVQRVRATVPRAPKVAPSALLADLPLPLHGGAELLQQDYFLPAALAMPVEATDAPEGGVAVAGTVAGTREKVKKQRRRTAQPPCSSFSGEGGDPLDGDGRSGVNGGGGGDSVGIGICRGQGAGTKRKRRSKAAAEQASAEDEAAAAAATALMQIDYAERLAGGEYGGLSLAAEQQMQRAAQAASSAPVAPSDAVAAVAAVAAPFCNEGWGQWADDDADDAAPDAAAAVWNALF